MTARISQTLEALRNRPNVVIIATTGSDMADLAPDIIKSSHIQTLPIPKPNEAERADIWMVQLMDRFKSDWSSDLRNLTNDTNLGDVSSAESSEAIELSMIDFMELSRRTDGFSGGDIHKVLERAAFDRLRKKITGGQPMQPINQQDLLKAIGNYQQP